MQLDRTLCIKTTLLNSLSLTSEHSHSILQVFLPTQHDADTQLPLQFDRISCWTRSTFLYGGQNPPPSPTFSRMCLVKLKNKKMEISWTHCWRSCRFRKKKKKVQKNKTLINQLSVDGKRCVYQTDFLFFWTETSGTSNSFFFFLSRSL